MARSHKKATLIVEASSTGFGVFSDAFPGITGYGKSVEAAKVDFFSSLQETKDAYGDDLPAELKPNYIFEYKYDIKSLLEHFPMLNMAGLAKKIGMNAKLLSRYNTGNALASEKQKKRIEDGLHELGQELLSVRL